MSLSTELRGLLMPWGFAVLLPMPQLMIDSPTGNSDVATLYLALGAAWLAAEAFRPGQAPASLTQWRSRLGALLVCLITNAAIFSVMGLSVGVQTNIPLPLLAILGIAPALGLVPWFTVRLRQPYAAIVLAAMTVALMKLAACVVARIVYGPDYIAQGYVSADWRTAKLMISLMWTFTLLASVLALLACRRRFVKS